MRKSSQIIAFQVILIFFSITSFSQFNKTGIPFFRNFSPKEYKAHNSNWAVVQDKRGLVYFGNNNNGVLEYDGKNWRQIPVPKNSIVRSLAVDSNGIIYVGAVGEFGYILPDHSGNLIYNSLSSELDSTIKYSNVWKTYVDKDNQVYFCSIQYLFLHNKQNKIEPIKLPEGCFFSFLVQDDLYIGNYIQGLLIYNKKTKTVDKVIGGDFFIDKDIFKILLYKKDILLISTYDGLYIYNTKDGSIETPANNSHFEKTNKFLIDNIAYGGVRIDDNLFAWATINAGIAIAEKKGKLIENYTDSTGVQDKQISDLYYCSDQGVLWATLNNGISKFEFNSPIRFFNNNAKLTGTVNDIIRFDGSLYCGTTLGLYYLDYNKSGFPVFKSIPELKGQSVNSLKIIEVDGIQHLIIGTSYGILEVSKNKVKNFIKSDIYAWVIYPSKFKQNTFYIGTERGLKVAKYVNGSIIADPDYIITHEVRSITEDQEGNLWIGSLLSGIYMITPEGKITSYSTNDGLPVMNDIYVTNINNNIIFATVEGFYKFDNTTHKFIKDDQFGNGINENKSTIISVFAGFNNQIWVNNNNRVMKLIKHYAEYNIDTIPFRRIPQMSVQVIYSEPDGLTWIGGSEGLFCYDNFFKRKYNIPYNTLVRKVSINTNDSVIFNGTYYQYLKDSTHIPSLTQSDEFKPTLKYKYNSLTFNFAAPYYEDESGITYSYFLEGFDENWSKWTTDNKAVYTNLKEGKYIFKVKALNIYGAESSVAEFEFNIAPPWYRTIWAYSGYAIVGILILIFSVKIYTRKLEADKRRLEGIVLERTAEVVRQKDEILDKNKEIELINKDITDSIRYAKRIQEALLPTENSFGVPSIESFIYFKPKDIVSGDFYFIRKIERSHVFIAAAADCTGHGVPGAFMSMLGMSFLNEIIIKPDVTHSDVVLNHLRESIIESLNQTGREGETKDGMDISLIAYNYEKHLLEFSGANNPLYMIRNNEFFEYKGDKMPIGLHDKSNIPFNRQEIETQVGDVIYLFSDGFPDQFGGEKGRKYMYKKFKEFLHSIHHLPMSEQRNLLEKEAITWRGEMEQIDDHIIMGIRIVS